MEWYKTLSINQRINLKCCCKLIVGLSWEELREIEFSFKEIIEILHNKLQLEGLID